MDIALGDLPIGVEFELPWGTKGTFMGLTEDGDADAILESRNGVGREAIFWSQRLVRSDGVMSPHVEAVA